MEWRSATEDIRDFFDESPDRSLGISLPTILENRIEQLLWCLFRDDDEKILRDLCKPAGPLGPFGVKVQLAYMLRLIDRRTFRDLELMIRIRNAFAHKLSVKTFDDAEISSRIKEMHVYAAIVARRDSVRKTDPNEAAFIDDGLKTMRDAFRTCVIVLLGQLHERQKSVVMPAGAWLRASIELSARSLLPASQMLDRRKQEPEPPPRSSQE